MMNDQRHKSLADARAEQYRLEAHAWQERYQQLASQVATALARMPPPPIMVSASQVVTHEQLAEAVKNERLACADVIQSRCEKCAGEGWLWNYELDNYMSDPHSCNTDDTRYLCDGAFCGLARHLRSIEDQDD